MKAELMMTQSCGSFAMFVIVVATALGGRLQAQNSVTAAPQWSADSDLVDQLSTKRPEFNYDESKVPNYRLPNPLVLHSGNPVIDAATWNSTRRPELLELFRKHVYGRRPETEYSIAFDVESESTVLDGAAVGRTMKATVSIGPSSFQFPFVVFLPTESDDPAPAFVFINNRTFPAVAEVTENYDSFYPVKDLIQRGYATASFFTSDVDPDRADGYADGIRVFFADGQPPTDDAWRSLSAWGFAASRVLDYLERIPQVDSSHVTVVGHSRGGKASLWAAAEDRRFSVAVSNQSGCGGAALSRRGYGETVGRITEVFPHWFCPRFATYAADVNGLPVDQHELISLIAPRGVYVTSADEDLWADPRGEYLSLVHAAPVFRLLGKTSIGNDFIDDPDLLQYASPPPLDQPQIVGQTGYHIGGGPHGLTHVDWRRIIDFVDGLPK
ncbi:hypothetical protein Poly51_19790 [Rubripirellula tenax]|uniref:4-O-methyl-glucuronoyl methylesterase-like domain-containing protein n=1 Tax=Rubripirellula tenax TaxID=2528015 RepID=A0A5C6FBQ8_9BACT|nr:acetylxylan esterase [Rubripirellula tenax]TWU59193.1 hypothetical protein Poly51_19790 [Rubripirellula tenax]